MSKLSPPWFWDTALLEWTVWVLLTAVVAAYAGRAVCTMATALLPGQIQWGSVFKAFANY
jgi:hypothetical protein